MKDDLISRRAIFHELLVSRDGKVCPDNDPWGSPNTVKVRYIKDTIRNVPAANARPERHSHWHEYESCVFMGRYGKDGEPIFQDRKTFMCVKCGRNTIIKEMFCPSCGAKMDGGKTNEID